MKTEKTIWYEQFQSWQDICHGFLGWDSAASLLPEPTEIIFAGYAYEDYSGDALVIFRKGRKYYTVHGSHCSCHGLEGQWEPEEYASKAILRKAMEKRATYGIFGQNREEILQKLK